MKDTSEDGSTSLRCDDKLAYISTDTGGLTVDDWRLGEATGRSHTSAWYAPKVGTTVKFSHAETPEWDYQQHHQEMRKQHKRRRGVAAYAAQMDLEHGTLL